MIRLVVMAWLCMGIIFGQEIVIKTPDGFALHGWLEKPLVNDKHKLVVMLHQFGADHTIWNDLSLKLRNKGYATLLMDLRGHGKSIMQNKIANSIVNDVRLDHLREAFIQSAQKVNFEQNTRDVSLMIEKATQIIGKKDLILFGSSLGGGVALGLVELEPKGIVVISTGSYSLYGENEVTLALANSSTPILLIAGKDDPLDAHKRSLEYSYKSPFATYIQVSSDGHGTVLLPKVEGYILDFLNNLR